MKKCQIIRNPKTNKITKVTAPNGKDSILYKSIKDSLPDKIELDDYLKNALINNQIKDTTKEELALGLWSKVYTSQFKQWFGDWENNAKNASKVVDQNGEPQLMYHGGNDKINSFNKAQNGIFFTDSKKVADYYASFNYDMRIEAGFDPKGVKTYPVFLKMQNPDTISKVHYRNFDPYFEKNNDGLIALNVPDYAGNENQYVVKEPNQIKSVFNNGDFNVQSNNIYYQLSDKDVREINPNVEKQMMSLLKAVGATVKNVEQIKDVDGNPINAAAKADALQGLIEVVEGKKTITTLPEETAHIITALLGPEHPMMKQMMSEIVNFDIYHEVKKEYANEYQHEWQFRFEAVGKMLAKNIIKGEPLGNYDKKIANDWVTRLFRLLAQMFYNVDTTKLKPELDIFHKVAKKFNDSSILDDITPPKYNKQDVVKLATDYNMSQSGFIKGEGVIPEILEKQARKLELDLATSEKGNYYFKRNGAKINPFASTFYQLDNSKDKILKHLLDDTARVSPDKVTIIDENGIEKETYEIDGSHAVKNRVSNAQDKKFNKGKTVQEIIDNNNNPTNIIYREAGTELHNINDDLLKIYADITPNLELPSGVKVPNEPKATSLINKPRIRKMSNSIAKLAEEISKQQQEIDKTKNATILTEQFVYDKDKDLGGSMDVVVLYSDGSAAIYDYKFINFKKEKIGNKYQVSPETEIGFSKRESYTLQIGEYKRILKDIYGIKNFRHTRILPFNVQYKYDEENKIIKKELSDIEGFDLDSSKNYLIPLPVANEITDNKKLNDLLSDLFKKERQLSAKIIKNIGDPKLSRPLIDESDLLKKSIRAIQTKTDVLPLIDSINKTLTNLKRLSKEATLETIHDLVLMSEEIELFENIYNNIIDVTDKKEDFNKIFVEIGTAKRIINEKIEELLLEEDKDINIPQRELSYIDSNTATMSSINHPAFAIARKLISESFGNTRRMLREFIEELEKHKKGLDNYSGGLLKAYEKLINPKTGNLRGKFSPEFHEDVKKKRKEGDVTWFKDNYVVTQEGKEAYEKDLKEYKDSLEGTPKEYYDYKLESWKNNHDLSRSSAWLKGYTLSRYTELKNPEKHYSDFYKEISNNKALKDYYDFYVKSNKYFNSLVEDKVKGNFIANVHKDIIDTIAQKGNIIDTVKNAGDNFINSMKVRQNDMVSVEGEQDNVIPLLYKDAFSYYNKKTGEWVNKSLDKSHDLTSNIILFAESVFNKHNMSKIKGTIEALKIHINNQKVIETDQFGKPVINKDTGELVPTKSKKNINYKVFEMTTNALVYGKTLQGKDYLMELANGDVLSMNKLIANIMSYMSVKSLSFNYVSAFGNMAGGYFNTYIKGMGGKYYTGKQMWNTHKLQFSRSNKDLYNHLTEFFSVENSHWSKDQAAKLSLNALTKNLTYDKWYLLQEKPDRFLANTILISMMQNYGLDSEGTPMRLALLPKGTKSLYDSVKRENDKIEIEGLSNEAFDDFRARVMYVTKQVKGTTNPEDISMMQTTIWGKSIQHFKSWIEPMVRERFGAITYTPEVKEWAYGRYRNLMSELFSKRFLPTLAKITLDILTFHKIKYKYDIELLKKEFEKWEKQNPDMKGKLKIEEFMDLKERAMREAIHEIKITSTLFLMILAARADWDGDGEEDYKKNALTKQLYKILNRSYLELSFFVNPASFRDIVKTPIPIMQVGTDVFGLIGNTGDEIRDAIFGENNPKDRTEFGHYTKKMIPGHQIFNFLEDMEINEDE